MSSDSGWYTNIGGKWVPVPKPEHGDKPIAPLRTAPERERVNHLRALARHEHDDHSIADEAAEYITQLEAELKAKIEALAEANSPSGILIRYHGFKGPVVKS